MERRIKAIMLVLNRYKDKRIEKMMASIGKTEKMCKFAECMSLDMS